MKYTNEQYMESVEYIRSRIDFIPETAIVLGTTLGDFSKEIEDPVIIDYKDIPNMTVTTNPDHEGKMYLGKCNGKYICCLSGRTHFYEGYTFRQTSYYVRILKLLGVKVLIFTNAAGSVNMNYKPGDLMVISDQIKFFDDSPLRGNNDSQFGDRFPDMTVIYDEELRRLAKEAGKNSSLAVHEGVYFFMQGPQFETPAEIRAIRVLGGDAVGMSTAPEAIVARHCGVKVLGISLITNFGAGVVNQGISGEEIQKVVQSIKKPVHDYLKDVIGRI